MKNLELENEALQAFIAALSEVRFGTVQLIAKIHDGKPAFRVTREVSIVPGKSTSGETVPD